jgi:hypothetical protein
LGQVWRADLDECEIAKHQPLMLFAMPVQLPDPSLILFESSLWYANTQFPLLVLPAKSASRDPKWIKQRLLKTSSWSRKGDREGPGCRRAENRLQFQNLT